MTYSIMYYYYVVVLCCVKIHSDIVLFGSNVFFSIIFTRII